MLNGLSIRKLNTNLKTKNVRKPAKLLFLALLVAACNTTTNNTVADKTNIPEQKETVVDDTTPKVTGIGGIFFGSKNPKETREWYGKNLGLALDEYGSPFEFRNANRPGEINYLRWSPLKNGSGYFAPSEKEFMINYRVQNIEGLVKKLKENGVTIVDTMQAVDYGKFIHIMDGDGNKIELWEPVDSVLTKLGGKTTK
jgi:predicted enzyme related to lactoylglutathione lyase